LLSQFRLNIWEFIDAVTVAAFDTLCCPAVLLDEQTAAVGAGLL
jgi:hypothetical protein